MFADDVRFLFAYDRWATIRVLAVLDGVDDAMWSQANVVGERGLGGVLVHQLGATQRWRIQFRAEGDAPATGRIEDGPLPGIDRLRELWDAEWAAADAWLPTLTDGFVRHIYDGVPVWQMLVHVVNHGTQHRSEAAALLTAAGHSPGELDLIDFAEDRARASSP
jgi:uncharacterized damage-inducible protein DinB